MGSPFRLIFYAPDSVTANRMAAASFHLVDSLNTVFSDYEDSSEINHLSRTAGSGRYVPVSSPLFEVLLASKQAAQHSVGAFDITIGPLSRLWRQARRLQRFPSKEAVLQAQASVGMQYLQLDSDAKKVLLLKENMQLDLGGIAKGYVAQKVVSFLGENGITSALADAGGDMACSDPPPGKKGWTVGINLPESTTGLLSETVELHNAAIATSGTLYQFMEYEVNRYSHISDPRTG